MKKITKTQATIISDLVTLLVESSKYESVTEARADFLTFFSPPGQQSMLEQPFTVKDLSYDQAQFAIDLYQHMLKMPDYTALVARNYAKGSRTLEAQELRARIGP